MAFLNRFAGAVKRGASAVQSAYRNQVEAAERRAKTRIEKARTRIERDRAKTDLALERVKLERDLYAAKLELKKQKDEATRLRRESGHLTFQEQLVETGKRTYRGLVGTPKKRRVARRPVRRTVRRRRG